MGSNKTVILLDTSVLIDLIAHRFPHACVPNHPSSSVGNSPILGASLLRLPTGLGTAPFTVFHSGVRVTFAP